MKNIAIAALILTAGFTASAQTKKTVPVVKKSTSTTKKSTGVSYKATSTFKSKLDSASYGFGLAMASNLKQGGLSTLNYELFNKGLKDAFNNSPKPLLTQQQCQEAISVLFESLSSKREEMNQANEAVNKQKYAANVNAGASFLAQNKTKTGVKTTASGLQYEVITPGTGKHPTAADQVTVNYSGTLLDGTEFDSSYKRGEPATFGLGQVIKGWTEGVQLMQEGSKYRFYIPYNLAYGGTGSGNIAPYSALIFEIELIKVN